VSIFALEAHRRDRRRVVGGEPVVDLPRGARQAAAVHRPEDGLVVQRAEQQQVLDHVGRAEEAPDARPRQGEADAVEEVAAVRHGRRAPAGAEDAARRVVGRDDQRRARRVQRRGRPPPGGGRLGDRLGPPGPRPDDALQRLWVHGPPARQLSTKYAPCPWPLERKRLVMVFLRV